MFKTLLILFHNLSYWHYFTVGRFELNTKYFAELTTSTPIYVLCRVSFDCL
jgi:hypothetical protein